MTENQTTETELPANLAEGTKPPGKLPEGSETSGKSPDVADDAETFPRDYVVKLRDENAKYRQRSADRDDLAAKLHTALVAATGRLADPSDLPFDDDHLTDADALTAALDALVSAKPHLASRKPVGDIGQGVSGVTDTFSIAGALRTNAT